MLRSVLIARRSSGPPRRDLNGPGATKWLTNPLIAVARPPAAAAIAWEPGKAVLMRGAATHVFTGDLDVDSLGKCAE